MREKLLEKAKNLPQKPGVYFMKDQEGKIIYVGKAKKLKNRVSSYFLKKKDIDLKTKKLVSLVLDFTIIIVGTEEEALILERSSIRQHSPRFNILFRDDKDYPYLEIDYHEKWPRLKKVRRKKRKDSLYFGPFASSPSLRSLLHNLYEIFPLIRCSSYEFEKRKKPCHYYHMKKCLAPCALPVQSEDYKNIMADVIQILKGGDKNIEKSLLKKMKEASSREEYELAASFRDQIEAFKNLRTKNNIIQSKEESLDAIGYAEKEEALCINLLLMRGGLLNEQKFFLKQDNILGKEETLRSFILDYYEKNDLPKKILLPFELENPKEIFSFLGKKTNIIKTPERGPNKKLLDLSKDNAFYHLEEALNKKALYSKDLEELKNNLKLTKQPRTIECLDISNLGESAIVASFVCFKDLKPSKEDYKIYHVKDIVDKADDFGSIREVMRRRLKRAIKEKDLPDLFVIDGGKGQLSSAYEVFNEFGMTCDLISLAKNKTKVKENQRTESHERIFFVKEEKSLTLSKYTLSYRILTQIRDEAHRFAVFHHRKKRDKETLRSPLLDIKGLGPSLHKLILKSFNTNEALKKATRDDFTALPRVSEEMAKSIMKIIKKNYK